MPNHYVGLNVCHCELARLPKLQCFPNKVGSDSDLNPRASSSYIRKGAAIWKPHMTLWTGIFPNGQCILSRPHESCMLKARVHGNFHVTENKSCFMWAQMTPFNCPVTLYQCWVWGASFKIYSYLNTPCFPVTYPQEARFSLHTKEYTVADGRHQLLWKSSCPLLQPDVKKICKNARGWSILLLCVGKQTCFTFMSKSFVILPPQWIHNHF